MQSLDNAVPAPHEAGTATAPSIGPAPRAAAPVASVVFSPDPDSVLLFASRDEAPDATRGLLVHFDPSVVNGQAAGLLGPAHSRDPALRQLLRPGLRLAGDGSARRALAEMPVFLQAPGVPDPDAPEGHAEHAADIVQRAVARLLLTFAGMDPALLERRDGRVTVDRACGFMAGNIARPLALEDVVQATGASSRTLQYAFLRRFGLSPMRWLREQRLRRLHAALQGASADQGVTDIAVGLGFTHLGRLGQLFEQRFGLLPRHLLRRTRSG